MHSKPMRLKVAKSSKKDSNGLVSFGMISSYIFVYDYAFRFFWKKMCTMLIFQANSWDLFKPWDIAPCHCKLVYFLFYNVVLFFNKVLNLSGFQKILRPGSMVA